MKTFIIAVPWTDLAGGDPRVTVCRLPARDVEHAYELLRSLRRDSSMIDLLTGNPGEGDDVAAENDPLGEYGIELGEPTIVGLAELPDLGALVRRHLSLAPAGVSS